MAKTRNFAEVIRKWTEEDLALGAAVEREVADMRDDFPDLRDPHGRLCDCAFCEYLREEEAHDEASRTVAGWLGEGLMVASITAMTLIFLYLILAGV